MYFCYFIIISSWKKSFFIYIITNFEKCVFTCRYDMIIFCCDWSTFLSRLFTIVYIYEAWLFIHSATSILGIRKNITYSRSADPCKYVDFQWPVALYRGSCSLTKTADVTRVRKSQSRNYLLVPIIWTRNFQRLLAIEN